MDSSGPAGRRDRDAVLPAQAEDAEPRISPTIGRAAELRLDGYRDLRLLHAAAGRSTWLAVAEGSDETVVAKVVRRLEHAPVREVRLLGAVAHEGLPRLLGTQTVRYDGAVHDVLLMEHVEGPTLAELIARHGGLSEPVVRHVGARIASALACLHASGIVHGDVKPANVLVSSDRGVKLVDLGIARRIGEADPDEGLHFSGTPTHASPEQVRGGTLGPPSDLYSLGVTLLEALSGANPFEGATALDSATRHGTLVAPRSRSLASGTSLLLDELVAALLEVDPRRRPGSAVVVAEALQDGDRSTWWRDVRADRSRRVSRSIPRLSVDRSTPFVGREAPLLELQDAWAAAREGRGRIVLVEAEAGAGKSRLVEAVLEGEEVRGTHATFLVSDASDEGLVGALREHFGGVVTERALLPFLAAPRLVAPLLRCFETADSTASPAPPTASLHAALAHLVSGMAKDAPIAWIVEDLHRASDGSTGLLASLARCAAGERLLLVVTSRPLADAPRSRLIAGAPSSTILRLPPLHPDDARRLAVALLGDVPAARKLAEVSRGNPLLAVAIARSIGRREQAGRAGVPGEVGDEVQQALRAWVASEVARIDPAALRLLQVAALAGPSIDAARDGAAAALSPLRALELLAAVAEGTALVRSDGSDYRFAHDVVQESLADSLSPVASREIHARLAVAHLARLGGACPTGEDAVFLARHFVAAGDRRGAENHVRAAIAHLDRSNAHVAIVELARHAATAFGDSQPALRCEMRLEEDKRLSLHRRISEQRVAIDDALAAAEASGVDSLKLRARLHLAGWHLLAGEGAVAEALAEALLPEMERLGDSQLIQRTLAAISLALSARGDFPSARVMALRWVDLAVASGQRQMECQARGQLGGVASKAGDYDEAARELLAAADIAFAMGDVLTEGRSLGNLGLLQSRVGDVGAARRTFMRALGPARLGGDAHTEMSILVMLGDLALFEGRFADTRDMMRAARPCCVAAGNVPAAVVATSLLMLAAQRQGDLAEAGRLLEEIEVHGRDVPAVRYDVALARGQYLLELGLGGREEAAAAFEESRSEALAKGHPEMALMAEALSALAGGRDPRTVSVPEATPLMIRAEVHAILFEAAGDEAHRLAALRDFTTLTAHLRGSELDAFWRLNHGARIVREAQGGRPTP